MLFKRMPWRVVLATLVVLAGCQTKLAAAPPEQSVRPGVNAKYQKPDLNVAQWVERFEREGREVCFQEIS